MRDAVRSGLVSAKNSLNGRILGNFAAKWALHGGVVSAKYRIAGRDYRKFPVHNLGYSGRGLGKLAGTFSDSNSARGRGKLQGEGSSFFHPS